MSFDYEAAKKEGYSDDEIADYLASQRKFDIAGARKEGYSSVEILAHLNPPQKGTLGKVGEFAKDVGAGLLTAPVTFAETLAGAGQMLNRLSPTEQIANAIDPARRVAQIAETKDFLGKAQEAKSFIQDKTLSDEAKRQLQEQSAISQDKDLGLVEGARVAIGQGLMNPRNTLRQVLENLPSLLAGGAAMRVAKGGSAAAQGAAGYTATGALEGGGAYAQTIQEGAKRLESVDDETLAHTFPSYADDLRAGLPRQQAILKLADRAATTAGGIAALFAPAVDKVLGGQKLDAAVFTRKAAESLPKAMGREFAAESLQGGGGQAAQNIGAKAYIDPSQAITEGVGAAAGGEGLAGLVSAGGMRALSPNGEQPTPPAPPTTAPSDPITPILAAQATPGNTAVDNAIEAAFKGADIRDLQDQAIALDGESNAKQLVSGQPAAAEGTAANEGVGTVVPQAAEAVQAANSGQPSGQPVGAVADLANTESRLNPANPVQESRVEPAVPNLSTTVPNSGMANVSTNVETAANSEKANGVRDAIDQLTQPISYDDARALVAGKTEKVGGVDPLKMIDAGEGNKKQYRLGNMPLSMFRENESGDRYDGTVDAKRATEYAQRPANEMPPVIALLSKDGTRLNVLDGGHRISAARMRGDATIPTLISLKNGVSSADGQQAGAAPQNTLGPKGAAVRSNSQINDRTAGGDNQPANATPTGQVNGQPTSGSTQSPANAVGREAASAERAASQAQPQNAKVAGENAQAVRTTEDRRATPRYNPEVDAAFKRANQLLDTAKTDADYEIAYKAMDEAEDLRLGVVRNGAAQRAAEPSASSATVPTPDRMADGSGAGGSTANTPQYRDLTTGTKGEIKQFASKAAATQYKLKNGSKTRGYNPREQDGKWVLSKQFKERSAAQKANDARLKAKAIPIDVLRDDMMEALRKGGGININDAISNGIDPADIRRANKEGFRKIFHKGGMSMDAAREYLAQGDETAGYLDPEQKDDLDHFIQRLKESVKEQATYRAFAGQDYHARLSAEAQALADQRSAMALTDTTDEFDQLSQKDKASVQSAWDSFDDEIGVAIHGQAALDEVTAADKEYTDEFAKREADAEAAAQDRERSVAENAQDKKDDSSPVARSAESSDGGNTKEAGSGAVVTTDGKLFLVTGSQKYEVDSLKDASDKAFAVRKEMQKRGERMPPDLRVENQSGKVLGYVGPAERIYDRQVETGQDLSAAKLVYDPIPEILAQDNDARRTVANQPVAPAPTSQERVAETGKSEQVPANNPANVAESPANPIVEAINALNQNISGLREDFALANQSPAELQAAQEARDRAKKEADNAARAADRKQANALERDAKKKREARVIQEREVEKKNEIDAGVANFALGQEPPKPVEKKVSTDEGFGQGNVFGKETMFSRKAADKQTNTPEFRAWFKDSKVVDAEGNPLVLYHGTARDFTEFSEDAESVHIKLPGFYFSPDPEIGNRFASSLVSGRKALYDAEGYFDGVEGGNVVPVYLSIQNPLIEDVGSGGKKGFYSEREIKALIDEAKRLGHDGVILRGWKDGSGAVQYIAFRPTQIKSAIGNRGTFDPNNPDIRFSRKGDTSGPPMVALHNLSAENLIFADDAGGLAVPSIAITRPDEDFSGFGEITLIGDRNLANPGGTNRVFNADAYTARHPDLLYDKVPVKKAQPLVDRFREAAKDADSRGLIDTIWDNQVNSPDPQRMRNDMQRSRGAMLQYAREHGIDVEIPMQTKPARFEWSREPAMMRVVKELQAEGIRLHDMRPSDPAWKRLSDAAREAIGQYWDNVEGIPKDAAERMRQVTIDDVFDEKTGDISFGYGSRAFEGVLSANEKEVDTMALEKDLKAKVPQLAFNKWVDRLVADQFDLPHIKLNGRKVLATLDNIVEAMTSGRGVKGREKSLTFGMGATKAAMSKEFPDFAAMDKSRQLLLRSKDLETIKEETKKLVDEFQQSAVGYWPYKSDSWGALDASMKVLARATKTGKATEEKIRAAMLAEGFKGPFTNLEEGAAAANALRNAAVPYFESKPQRAVKLNEFAGAVVPADPKPGSYDYETRLEANRKAKDVLERNGIPYREYDDGNRAQVVQDFAAELNQQQGDVMFSRQPKQAQSIEVTDAETAAKVISKKWKNAPDIIVSADATSDKVDAGLRAAMAKDGVTDARGAWYGGKIYIFTNNISSLAELERTVVHEARHYGLEGLFGKDMNPILMEIYMKDKGVRTEANRLVKTLKLSTVDAANETLANMDLAAAKKLPAWKKLVAKLKSWLNDHGFTNLAKMLEGPTADEITKDILFQIEDFVKTGKRSDTTFTTTLFHRAFHGSPHDHDGFSLDKIGTGEGAQAYGWGLYFAGSKAVADHYRQALSSGGFKTFNYAEAAQSLGIENYEDIRKVFYEMADSQAPTGIAVRRIQNASAASRNIDQSKLATLVEQYRQASSGKLYEVELAPKQEDYLDWDKPLSEQSESVLDGIKDLFDTLSNRETDHRKASLLSFEFQRLNRDMSGEALYKKLAAMNDTHGPNEIGIDPNGERKASELLKSVGIPGIRYLDGSSRSKGEGNHNFVIFSADDISIVAKFSRSGDSSPVQNKRDSLIGNAKLLADVSKAPAFIKHGFSSLDAPSKRLMLHSVFAMGQDLKVREAIIKAIPVDMMDVLRAKQLSPQMLFHDESVLFDLFSVNSNVPVSMTANAANAAVRMIATAATKQVNASFPHSGRTLNGDAAVVADVGSHTRIITQQTFDDKDVSIVAKYSRTDQTESPAFKRWFSGSKVVDENGKPLVVYHGSIKKNLTRFDMRKAVEVEGGFFFTNNRDVADQYTYERAYGDIISDEPLGNVVNAYLSIQNPLNYTPKGRIVDAIEMGRAIKMAKASGHDGVIIRNIDDSIGMTGDMGDVFVAFEPTQIKSADGNSGAFDGTNPDIRYSRASADAPKKWDAPEPSKMDSIIYKLQDKQVDLRRVIEAVKDGVGDIQDTWNAYLKEEMFHGRSAKRVADFARSELKPLLTDMQMRGVTIPELETYLHNRHAEERNKQVAKINPKLPDRGSGITTKNANDWLKALPADKKAKYEALAKKVDAITKGTRQTLQDYGLMSNAEMRQWEGAYKHYVPLMKDTEVTGQGEGFSIRGDESKRAMGDGAIDSNILANLMAQRERAIVRGEKNRVALSLYGLAKLNPNPDFWTVDNPPIVRRVVKLSDKADRRTIPLGMDIPENATEVVVEGKDPMFLSRDNVIVTKYYNPKTDEVTEKAIVFNEDDPRAVRMAAALKNLDADQMGEIMNTMAKATRFLASVNTQYNPIFGLVNLTRDVQGAALNLSSTPLAGKQKQVLSKTLPALAAVYLTERNTRKGREPQGEWAKLYDDFQNTGAQTGYRDLFTSSQDRADALQAEINKITEGKVKKAGRAVFDWLSDYNQAMENSVRLAAYKVGLDQGMSKEQAASVAKNLTVNFNRKGQITQQAGALYAFFNASVQGTARLAQTLNGPAGKRIIIGGLVLGALQAMMLAGFDEDEPPQFERERNLIIPIGGKDYVKIPMPLGLHVIPNYSRILIEMGIHGKPMDRLFQMMSVTVDAFNPIGSVGLSAQTFTPTVADPFVALGENRDWTGKPISREDFSSLNPTPGHSRAKDTATWHSKVLSEGLNWLSGGTEYTKGKISPTPDQLDYLIGQVTGGVGREASKIQQTVSAGFTGEELPPHKIPVVGRFYGSTGSQASKAALFYRNLKQLNAHEAEIEGRQKNGQDASDYIRDNPDSELYEAANQVERQISKMVKAKRQLVKDGADRKDVKELEDAMAEIMGNFNEIVAERRGK